MFDEKSTDCSFDSICKKVADISNARFLYGPGVFVCLCRDLAIDRKESIMI